MAGGDRGSGSGTGHRPRCTRIVVALAVVTSAATLGSGSVPASPSTYQLVPDLTPVDVVVEPPRPHEGEVLRVVVAVANRGEGAAGSAALYLADHRPNGDVVPIGTTRLARPLPAGDVVLLTPPAFVAVGVGIHTLTAQVADVVPDDANRTNDRLLFDVTTDPSEETPPRSSPSDGTWFIALFAGIWVPTLVVVFAILVTVAAIRFLPRRSKHTTGELLPPPPEPPDRRPPPIRPP